MNKKLKFIHKNPTETEKLMYANHGLYPIEKKPLFVKAGENNDIYYWKYVVLHADNKEVFPEEVCIEEKYIDYDEFIQFSSDAELISIKTSFMDMDLLSLIYNRAKELGWT